MPNTTTNLNLYKYNSATDGNSTFNIDLALNENWDKIDADSKTKADSIQTLATQVGDMAYSDDTGTANNYILTIPNVTSLKKGQRFRFKAKYNNSGASTLNVNGLGAKKIIQSGLTSDKITIDFKNKVAGSVVENPNISYHAYKSSLMTPSEFPTSGIIPTQNNYNSLMQLDNNLYSPNTLTNLLISQKLFSFNVIEEIERRIGSMGSTLAEKVANAKNMLSKITCNWWGYGSGPSGNKAYLGVFNITSNVYDNTTSHSNSSVYPLIAGSSTMSARIDNNGFIHANCYSDSSNGTVASTINTDNVSLELEFKPKDILLGDIQSGQMCEVMYDGTNFQLTSVASGKVSKDDYVSNNAYAVTTGTSTAYTVTLNPAPTSYADGMQITVLPHVDCGATPTLNINGLGALTIVKQDGSAIASGEIKANKPLSLVRVGSNFFIRSGVINMIKRMQKGTAQIGAGALNASISISAVDITKAVLIMTSANNSSTPSAHAVMGVITSSTNIDFTRHTASGVVDIEWQVIEFNNIKSVQMGTINGGSQAFYTSEYVVNVANFDVNKYLLFFSWNADDNSSTMHNIKARAINSTSIGFKTNNSSSGGINNLRWYLVEFN